MKFALVFPGQGSQFAGMADGYAAHPQVAAALDEASDAISVDLKAMATGGEKGGGEGGGRRVGGGWELNITENTQPAMLAMDVGVFRAFAAEVDGVDGVGGAVAMCGHSLGEYAALTCAGSMDFADAVRAARFRGLAMARATPPGTGAISAVIGLGAETADIVCAELRDDGHKVWTANHNAPKQVVIAGEADAVARAADILKTKGAKKIAPLPMSAPSHCPLMSPAADELAEFLQGLTFNPPRVAVLHNQTACECESAGHIPQLLRAQVVSPVLWIDTVQALAKRADCLAECGPGKTLTGLGKRIAPEAEHCALDDSSALQAFARRVLG